MRRILTVWVIRGVIGVLLIIRAGLIWGIALSRRRAMVKAAQDAYYKEQFLKIIENHPSQRKITPESLDELDEEDFRSWRMREDDEWDER